TAPTNTVSVPVETVKPPSNKFGVTAFIGLAMNAGEANKTNGLSNLGTLNFISPKYKLDDTRSLEYRQYFSTASNEGENKDETKSHLEDAHLIYTNAKAFQFTGSDVV